MAIGLEKENLVLNYDLQAVKQKEAELPKNVTLDFADHQLEIVSTPKNSIRELINEMYVALDSEVFTQNHIWPLSQGYGINSFTIDGKLKASAREYRTHLKETYDNNLLLLSGIHFNYSSNKEFEIEDEKMEYHFNLLKKVYEYGPIISQFVSFTPYYEQSSLSTGLTRIGKNYGYPESISLRNTQNYGYYNEHKLNLNYSNVTDYLESIKGAIRNEDIACKDELYSKVRLKSGYIELRFIDLNPYTRLGITEEVLTLLTKSMEYFETIKLEKFDIDNALINFEKVAINGRNKQIKIVVNNELKTLAWHTNKLFEQVLAANVCNEGEEKMLKNLLAAYNQDNTDLDKMFKEFECRNLTVNEFGMRHLISKDQFTELYPNYNMELSTKILMAEAKKRGLKVEVLDEQSNVIELSNKRKRELVVQATKTNADRYADVLMLENKYMTKLLLERNGISVPSGQKLTRTTSINYTDFCNAKMVVKPLDTNFGLGITILEPGVSFDEIDKAVGFAFEYSDVVLTEQFASGKEYRFLVINDELVSVVHRIPAHVIGDGVHTIEQLVAIKNQNPLRGENYHRPVEKIKIGEFEQKYLLNHGYSKDTIAKSGQIIYLRENSNVSTGGDSYELIDQIPAIFCQKSVEAARTLNAKICGIDMIIENINDENSKYTIIEANFNPAIQMHTYPYYGYGRNVASKIIDLLFNVK